MAENRGGMEASTEAHPIVIVGPPRETCVFLGENILNSCHPDTRDTSPLWRDLRTPFCHLRLETLVIRAHA